MTAALLDRGEPLLQVADDVVNVLRTNGQADGVGPDALIQQLLRAELGVGGGGGVDDQGLHVGHIGQQGEDLQAVDKLVGLGRAALDFKGEDGRAAVGEILLIQGVVGVAGQGGWLTFSTCGWLARNSTTFLVFSAWRSSRRDRVSTPWRSRKALKGEMQAPVSRRMTARI